MKIIIHLIEVEIDEQEPTPANPRPLHRSLRFKVKVRAHLRDYKGGTLVQIGRATHFLPDTLVTYTPTLKVPEGTKARIEKSFTFISPSEDLMHMFESLEKAGKIVESRSISFLAT